MHASFDRQRVMLQFFCIEKNLIAYFVANVEHCWWENAMREKFGTSWKKSRERFSSCLGACVYEDFVRGSFESSFAWTFMYNFSLLYVILSFIPYISLFPRNMRKSCNFALHFPTSFLFLFCFHIFREFSSPFFLYYHKRELNSPIRSLAN